MLALLSERKKAILIARTIKMAFLSEYCYSIYGIIILAFFGGKINIFETSIYEEAKLNDCIYAWI